MKNFILWVGVILGAVTLSAVRTPTEAQFDLLIAGGNVVDGTGNPWYAADVGIGDGRIAAIGKLSPGAAARRTIDARGLVVAPGFIDMLGQSEITLLVDGRAESKIRQGITSEVTGEGDTVAPQNERTLPDFQEGLDFYHLKADWRTLDEYFQRLASHGTTINLGTYVGATQVRQAVLGGDDRGPTPAELEQMKQMVAQAMQQGALGVSTALVYSPAIYAKTDELIALASVAASYGGIYASHIRNEGAEIFPALDEAFRIGREAHIPVQIFHLKVAGRPMWGRMPEVVRKIDEARASGLDVTANMYPYTAGATALAACLPPWAQDGGTERTLARLRNPAARERMKEEMGKPAVNWESFYYDSGGAANILLSSFVNEKLRPLQGMRLSEAAAQRHQDPLDALLDLCLEDRLQAEAIYFLMDPKDVEQAAIQPWTSFGLDASAVRPDGLLGSFPSHPRGYGTFARLLGRYVRDDHLLPLEQMVRKMTSLPAQTARIEDRGVLRPGLCADVTIFDLAKVRDVATYENPNQYSEGFRYVIVNGQVVLDDGKMTGAMPGEIIRGAGYRER